MSPTELPRRCVLGAIRLYQLTLSPYVGGQCRFYPTCSHYAMGAIQQHGLLRGGGLAIGRLGRCHPFHPGGVDLVPGSFAGAGQVTGPRAGEKES